MFKISSSLDGRWVGPNGKFLPKDKKDSAADVSITFGGNGAGYSLEFAGGNGVESSVADPQSKMTLKDGSSGGFKVWSVTYH